MLKLADVMRAVVLVVYKYWSSVSSIVVLFLALVSVQARADEVSSYYNALDLGAKKAIQQNLIWTGYYPGPVDGVIGATTLQAIKHYQQENSEAPTGIMSARVRDALARRTQEEQRKIDFRYVIDRGTGARIGIPFAYISEQRETLRGRGYYSRDRSIEVQTFAFYTALRDLPSLYTKLKDQIPNRKVWYSPYRDGWFVLAGRDLDQNNQERDFYIRVETNGVQLRGFSISYTPDRYPNIPIIIAAMSFTFDPFPVGSTPPNVAQYSPEEPVGGPNVPIINPQERYWLHNGSKMKLVAVGNSRKFYYLEPRLGMVAAGAMPGSLLFDGIAINNSYIGTAYIFNRRCGTVSYKVEGPILDDYRRVELTGMAPRIDTNCHVSSYFEDRLEFVLVEPTVTTANTENHFHSIKSDDGFLNLRNGPGTNHDIVVTIPSGVSDVAVSQCRPSDVLGELPWCKAEWEGHSGWLSSCCIIGDSAAAATPINNEGQGSIIPRPVESATVTEGAAMVPMLKEGGTYEVPVLINNAITLNFIVDSGSSDVSIPADVVLTLIRAGTINEGDFIGERTYRLADGSTVPARTFHIRSLKVGNRVLENVTGSVAPIAGGLLLGQSFLSRFKSWSIDNMRHALLLNE